MKRVLFVVGIICAVAGLSVAVGARQGAKQAPADPPFTRTQLQDQTLSIKDRHAVMARSEFKPNAESGRHSHPGEELGYILEGTVELTVDGKAPVRLKAGDTIFMPANTVHNAKNVGTGPLRIVSTYVLEVGKPLATPAK